VINNFTKLTNTDIKRCEVISGFSACRLVKRPLKAVFLEDKLFYQGADSVPSNRFN